MRAASGSSIACTSRSDVSGWRDRLARRGAGSAGRRSAVALLAALAVGVSLAAIAALGGEVARKLNALESARADNVEWALSQAEVELLRLQAALLDARPGSADDLGRIRRRFDIFFSRIEMLDKGPIYGGTAEERLARIFDDFETGDSAYDRRAGGTGRGLGIARRMTEAMGGEIGAESEEGEGSLFWLRVPLEIVAETGEVIAALEHGRTGDLEATVQALHRIGGTAGTFGAARLRAQIHAMDHAGTSGDSAGLLAGRALLCAIWEETRAALGQLPERGEAEGLDRAPG